MVTLAIEVKDVKKILLTGDDTPDDVITIFIGVVEDQIAFECEEKTMPEAFKNIGTMIVVSLCNQRGKEGFNTEREGELSVDIARDLLYPYRPQFKAYVKRKDKKVSRVMFI